MTTIAEILWENYNCKAKTSTGKKQHMQLPSGSKSVDDIITFIDDISDGCNCSICLLVHNIDGPALRDPDSQQYLARVSCCSCISLVASIDHVNAPVCKI
jgi:origin recognition complex subunit 2